MILCCKSLIGFFAKSFPFCHAKSPFASSHCICSLNWVSLSLVKLQTLHAFGDCVCGKPACKKKAVFYTETLTAASHYQCLLMPFLDLKAGLALSPECVTVYCSRSGKCDLSCSFRGFLKLQQQIVMIFNVRNVIGTLSYVTVIPASMSLQWPLTNVMERPFRINTPSGNKEFNGNGRLRKKGTSCALSLFNSLSRFAWIKHKPSRNQGFLTGLNLLMCEKTIIFCTNTPELLRLCFSVTTFYILDP